jgi:hypothetical protein
MHAYMGTSAEHTGCMVRVYGHPFVLRWITVLFRMAFWHLDRITVHCFGAKKVVHLVMMDHGRE